MSAAISWTTDGVVESAATFRCGHPRTPENSWGKTQPRCKLCCQARKRGERTPRSFIGDGVTTYKACGHPKTPENSWGSGRYPCCATCHYARCERWRKHGPLKQRVPRRRVSAQPDYSSDPSVAAYRLEKARRAANAPAVPTMPLPQRERSIPRYWRGAA